MTKEDVLKHLGVAKSAHIKLVQKAKALIDSIDMSEPTSPINFKESDFGKWFYSDGQKLSGLSNNPLSCMENMQKQHLALYEMNESIFNIYFGKSQKAGFFSKILGSANKPVDDDGKKMALEYYENMQSILCDLESEISRLERRLSALSEEKIEALG